MFKLCVTAKQKSRQVNGRESIFKLPDSFHNVCQRIYILKILHCALKDDVRPHLVKCRITNPIWKFLRIDVYPRFIPCARSLVGAA